MNLFYGTFSHRFTSFENNRAAFDRSHSWGIVQLLSGLILQPLVEIRLRNDVEICLHVVMAGTAQERASVWRSWPRKGQEKAVHPHMDWGRLWPIPTISIFTCGMPNGVPRSGRPTPRLPFPFGFG
jgi:hypothetical protein